MKSFFLFTILSIMLLGTSYAESCDNPKPREYKCSGKKDLARKTPSCSTTIKARTGHFFKDIKVKNLTKSNFKIPHVKDYTYDENNKIKKITLIIKCGLGINRPMASPAFNTTFIYKYEPYINSLPWEPAIPAIGNTDEVAKFTWSMLNSEDFSCQPKGTLFLNEYPMSCPN